MPVLLLLLLVAVPTLAILWLVGVAMDNQALATQQRLMDAYRLHLENMQQEIEAGWQTLLRECDELTATQATPPQVFSAAVERDLADAVVVLNADGTTAYPNSLSYSHVEEQGPAWLRARELENYAHRPLAAHDAYEKIAQRADSERERMTAIQSQLRCLVKAQARDRAVALVDGLLAKEELDRLRDPRARSTAVNLMLMSLEQLSASDQQNQLCEQLVRWTQDYSDEFVASPQRLFILKRLADRFPQQVNRRLVQAEAMAAEYIASRRASEPAYVARSLAQDGVWSAVSPQHNCVVLLSSENLRMKLTQIAAVTTQSIHAKLHVLPPGDEAPVKTLVSRSAGTFFPGWRLALSLPAAQTLDSSTVERNRLLWTGVLVVMVTSVLAFLSVRVFRRQLHLANLKNDLVGTVSHELKTPLSSMRLLVDTLLDEEEFDATTTREYLTLISKENLRLSRLIESFLTFSRMERDGLTLEMRAVEPAEVVRLAIESAGDRFQSPDCRLSVAVDDALPTIRADEDGLVTVLLNLMDNAYKYSQPVREILVAARRSPDGVSFVVADRGIGIARSARRRIFHRFYQVDRGLARASDGCGLGLSIVQSLVKAHGGKIDVQSEPGQGSTLTVTIPASDRG